MKANISDQDNDQI